MWISIFCTIFAVYLKKKRERRFFGNVKIHGQRELQLQRATDRGGTDGDRVVVPRLKSWRVCFEASDGRTRRTSVIEHWIYTHTHTHTDVNIDSCSYCIQTSKINHPYGNEGVHFHQSLFSWLIVRAIECFSRFPEAHGDVFKLMLSLELQQLFNQYIYRKLIQLFCWSIKEKCQMFDGSRFINVRIYCFSWSLHDNKLNIFSVLDYLLDKTRY